MSTITELLAAGQSVWYDNIQRSQILNGEMAGMIQRGEIRGITSNPSIFLKAITKSQDYDDSLTRLAGRGLKNEEMFFRLAIEDIQGAAQLFYPLFENTHGGDGYVSIEVSPDLAYDTEGTLRQVLELQQRVNYPNLMIKIPANQSGIPAIAQATASGVNVNITLIFSRQRYMEVMDAYLTGLEERVSAGKPIDKIASVASFFVSRVDTKVDKLLDKIIQSGDKKAEKARSLLGKAAIANARLAYADFKQIFSSERFQKLADNGARVQRPLWASTSTKNPAYSDVMYIEELIGPQTINTIPPQTIAAFLDHGKVRLSLEENLDAAQRVMDDLEELGISMQVVTAELEEEGIETFSEAFKVLLQAIAQRVEG